MERITISLDADLLGRLDSYLERNTYTNRSEAVRDILRGALASERVTTNERGPCLGCLVYVYSHEERSLSNRLVETQHHHHGIPKATLHLHIDEDTCLEATVLEGTVADVQDLANRIITETGVRHGQLYVIPRDE